MLTLQRRARHAYELSRLREAALGVTPVLVVVALAMLFSTRVLQTGLLGSAVVGFGLVALWWGNGLERSFVLGVLAGLLPLVTALCTLHLGHALLGPACMPVCYGANFAGGLAAGSIVGGWSFERKRPPGSLLAASAFGVVTASMGCSCVGLRGVAALVGGFVVTLCVRWGHSAWQRSARP